MQDPRTYPLHRAIADPATVNYTAGSMQSPSMSLDGVPFAALIGAGGGVTAAMLTIGTNIVNNLQTAGLVTAGVDYRLDAGGAPGEWTATGCGSIASNLPITLANGNTMGAINAAVVYGFDFNAATLLEGNMCSSSEAAIPSVADPRAGIRGFLGVTGLNYASDGALWEQLRTASAANVGNVTNPAGAQLVADVGNWAQHAEPAVAVLATTTRAAGGAGVRHVCTSISATLNAVAAIGAPISLYLRDGAAGAGAILRSWRFIVPIGESAQVDLAGLSIVGSVNTAMTLEWGAAPGAGNFENVSLSGYSIG